MKVSRIVSALLVCMMALASIPALAAEPLQIRFSHNQPVGSPEDVGAQAMKTKLEELAGDRVKVEVYPASQLGSLREQIESTQMGAIQISLQPVSVLTPFVDDIKLIDFPYLLPSDRNKVFQVLDSEIGQEALSPLDKVGLKGLGYWFAGYKLFTTKKNEIHTPDDFKGLRIRVMDSPLLISQYKAWGATAVPIAYAELYNSLQQNVVDGQENPIQTIVLNNYQEVQGQIVQSYHGSMTYILVVNKPWFESLPQEIRDFVTEAEKFGRVASRENYAVQEKAYIEKLESAPNVHYYSLTEEEIARFRDASAPVYTEHATSDWQKEHLKKLQEAFAK
jgi:C4-dicarboxylate-binding protein DctP